MTREQIQAIADKKIEKKNISEIKNILEKKYDVSYGNFEPIELRKAIKNETPVFIKDNLIIGYDPDGRFYNSENEKIAIERPVNGVIVEGEKEPEEIEPTGDFFYIQGKAEWFDDTVTGVIGGLRVGAYFLPPHSAIFNFLNPSPEQEKKKIVSMLDGVNINIYQAENAVDNAIHEIGHLFWRDCVILDEKMKFKKLFDYLKPSAIYNFKWEKDSEEEVFCTIYKWYVKSLLLNKSFLNILKYEEPEGLKLLEAVFARIQKDKLVNDVWELSQADLLEYFNPPIDRATGRRMRRAGLREKIQDLEIPRHVLNNIDRYEKGSEFISLHKAVTVPVANNKIDWEKIK